jgi:hypothetical protein
MNVLSAIAKRIRDYRHERHITQLYRDYNSFMRMGKHVVASAVMRDIKHAIEQRSFEEWARVKKRDIARMDPHARAALQQESRA